MNFFLYLVLGQNRGGGKGRAGKAGRLDGGNEKSILRDLVQRKKRDTVNTILHRGNKAKLSQPGR